MPCIALLLFLVLPVSGAVAQPAMPWASGQLQLQGTYLSIYHDAQVNDADQTINVGESARIRTCFGVAGSACGTIAGGGSGVAGLRVLGELTGPELNEPLTLETMPGGTFVVPGFQMPGDYELGSIRLVDSSGRVLATAEPSLATLHVRQILMTSATVTALSLADLQAMGITITQQNFKAFNFAVGFAFAGETVTIDLPILFTGNGQVGALGKPDIKLDGLPPAVAHAVGRWQPPFIIPFGLEGPAELAAGGGTGGESSLPEIDVVGAIVLPGTLSYLNQFFDAKLIVANGAPAGSGAVLRNITGAIRLPRGSSGEELLRLAWTNPRVAPGQKVPVLTAANRTEIDPGEQGLASWTVEGLEAGTHSLRIDIEAELERPGRDPKPLTGVTQAAVEVVDPRFHLTFSHPDVVREGEPYTLFVTVANLSRATQALIGIDLRENMTNVEPADGETLTKEITQLEPGQAETVEFRLVPSITGRCYATTFQADSAAGVGSVRLHVGVGEAGIPLSPATLVMPRFTDLLPEPLVRANVRLLGLGYSLAVAPAGSGPSGLPRVIQNDVERRAVDLAEAGQRLFLKDGLLESLEALTLDQLGNRHPLEEYDALRRALEKGKLAAAALADEIRKEQDPSKRNLDAVGLLDHFATTMSYARPWLGVTNDGGASAPAVELRRVDWAGTTHLADAVRYRTMPFGEIYSVASGAGTAPLAIVGNTDFSEAVYQLLIHSTGAGSSTHVVAVVPNHERTGFLRVDFGNVRFNGATDVYLVNLAIPRTSPSAPNYRFIWASTLNPVDEALAPVPAVSAVALPPFKVIGIVQDMDLLPTSEADAGNRYAMALSYLFSRPPDAASLEDASAFHIRTLFHGQDTASPAQTFDRAFDITGEAAFLQTNSERVVHVRYSAPINPSKGIFEGQPIITHEHSVSAAVKDAGGNALDPTVPDLHLAAGPIGGLVDGKVIRGSGEVVQGAVVQLIRDRCIRNKNTDECKWVHDLVSEMETGADGAFFFPFIQEPPPALVSSGFSLRAMVPASGPDPEETEEIRSVARLVDRLAHVSIALLGRGSVSGRLLYEDGAPVAHGSINASSTLFSEEKQTESPEDGSFAFTGLPVGPITLTGRDTAGRRAYVTVAIERPGQAVTTEIRIPKGEPPRTGTVTGHVLFRRGTTTRPAPWAHVAVYAGGGLDQQATTNGGGEFRLVNVPAGLVSVQAADFSVSRSTAVDSVTLGAEETATVTLEIPEALPRVVIGRVLFHDPLTNTDVPVVGAPAFIPGPGVFAYTDSNGNYRIENVPVQGTTDTSYQVMAIDYSRQLQGSASLPPVLASEDPDLPAINAPDILLETMTGAIEGVVLDPLGRPAAGVAVMSGCILAATTDATGAFRIDRARVGDFRLVAHVGDGLTPGRVGWIGEGTGRVIFGGHTARITIKLRGSGIVTVRTGTAPANSTGDPNPISTPFSYWPTLYLGPGGECKLGQSGADGGISQSTDEMGKLELELPVGSFGITARNPFHGSKGVSDALTYPGQTKTIQIVFDRTSTVVGQVLDVDGMTPVPFAWVTMNAGTLGPQRQKANADGRFLFEAVPPGGLQLTSAATIGSVDRVARSFGMINSPGQTLEIKLQMRPKGSVRGRVLGRSGPDLHPLPGAEIYLQEGEYPNRRIPAEGYLSANAAGEYEVSGITAGPVYVIARDKDYRDRQGRERGEITFDWQVVPIGDIVLDTSVGALEIYVTDPSTGAPVPDCQITLSNGEMAVADQDGRASYDALPLGTYSVYAFHAPTGRGGRADSIRLLTAGERVTARVMVNERGEIAGTLWDDPAKTAPVGAATVAISGSVDGRLWSTSFTALAMTPTTGPDAGKFRFVGIPPGRFDVRAGVDTSPRRASAIVTLSPTAPLASIDLVLEQVEDRHVRLFEKLTTGVREIDTASGIFQVEARQAGYGYILSTPTVPSPNHRYEFPDVLVSRSIGFGVTEMTGEQRTASAGGASLVGAGSFADPYRITMTPKGIVRVLVEESAGGAPGVPVGNATVILYYGDGLSMGSASDVNGRAVFYGVPAGGVTAVARLGVRGGSKRGAIVYDDDLIDLTVTLAPVVSARGVVYLPPEGDIWDGDVASLDPAAGAIVEITDRDRSDNVQLVATAEDGTYEFPVLLAGNYRVEAITQDGTARAEVPLVTLTEGSEHVIPRLILDASAPRIVSIVPPPGQDFVSRTRVVEIVFSEPLDPDVLPAGLTASHFRLTWGNGVPAAGTWSSSVESSGRQVVQFIPSVPYENRTVYSLVLVGGQNGIRDRIGRPLNASGDLGSNFTTSDTVGPAVIATLPSLSRPVNPEGDIRFDFNEPLTATDEQLDGDGDGDAPELFWGRSDGAGGVEWMPLFATGWMTRGGFSLVVQQPLGLSLAGDTLKRKIRISSLRDAFGNPMPTPYEGFYRIWDKNAPQLSIGFPSGAAEGGTLSHGTAYLLEPVLTNLDDQTAENPAGDIDRVDYYLGSSTHPSEPAPLPAFSARTFPFTFGFTAAYVGDGFAPRPFPVWVEAVDTSTNKSSRIQLAMQVSPNAAPRIASVTVAAISPVAGTPYAGSRLTATVNGLEDEDRYGAQVTLSAELRKENLANPHDPADILATATDVLISRPDLGWASLTPPTVTFTLPIATPEGTRVLVRAKAIDSLGATGTASSEAFPVADDATAPIVESVVAHLVGSTTAATTFTIGETFVVDVKAGDAETAVKTVSVAFDGVFTSPQTSTLVDGTTDLYRTAPLAVPSDVPQGGVAVNVTAQVDDVGGNRATMPLAIRVEPTADPTAPAAKWVSPWSGAPWPAAYTSVAPGDLGAPLLLRVEASDMDEVAGTQVPGEITLVEFRGPANAAGDLASDWTPGVLASGTPAKGVYQLLWRVPDGIAAGTSLPFEARVSDRGAHRSVVRAVATATSARRVFENVQTAVLPSDAMSSGDPDGLVFLLGGTLLSIYPQTDGSVRQLPGLVLYAGGDVDGGGSLTARPTVLTAPEITSYDSSIPYYPLELGIDRLLGVAHGCRLDVAGRGYLGNDTTHSLAAPGQTAAGVFAGGSHGGHGWFGMPQGYMDAASYTAPGSVYDSTRDPRLAGGGGGAGRFGAAGRAGGGVIRVLAPNATLALYGSVLADGGTTNAGGGGAGGAVRLQARRIEGSGLVSANGSNGWDGQYGGTGGGGRVAISYVDTEGADVPWVVEALGGSSDGYGYAFGGAGTVFLERVDGATGTPIDAGRLFLANRSGQQAATTPLPALGEATLVSVTPASKAIVVASAMARGTLAGESVFLDDSIGATTWTLPIQSQETTGLPEGQLQMVVSASDADLTGIETARAAGRTITARLRSRFASLTATAAVRLDAVDDLEVAGVLNDRAAMALDAETRVILRGEAPQLSLAPTPVPGDVNPGTSVSIAWSASDPLGLAKVEQTWTLGGAPATRYLENEPLQASQGTQPLVFTIPVTTPAGDVIFGLKATDRAGRVTQASRAWRVLADTQSPHVDSVELTPGKPGDIYTAGEVVRVTVRASDNVAVAKVRITLNGATTEFAASLAEVTWTTPSVDTQTHYPIGVEVLDYAENRVAESSRVITVVPLVNPDAPVATILCPGVGAMLPSGYDAFTVQATATDDVGVARIEFFQGDAATPFFTATPSSGTPVTFAATSGAVTLPVVTAETTVRFRVLAWDASNNSGSTFVDVKVVPAVELKTNWTDAEWASATDKIAYLKTGTLAIDTPRTLGGLLVLRGASVTHSASAAGAERSLSLAIAGPVYVECGGAIDVSGKGYPRGVSYPGSFVKL